MKVFNQMFPGCTILIVTLKGDAIRHICDEIGNVIYGSALKHQTLQFSLSHHTLQHTISITNPLLAQINETLRHTVASCTNILAGVGVGGGRTLIFSHISRLRPFLGVQNLFVSIFLGIFRKKLFGGICIYK